MLAQTQAAFILIHVLIPASISCVLLWTFFSVSWHVVCLVLVSGFQVWAEKWLFFGGRFLATNFGKRG